jgi:putative oxidoreductase
MLVAATVARILLGLLFTLVGITSLFMTHPPSLPGLAGEFNDAFMQSHWSWFIAAAQIVIGVLFLANRYVPLALVILAGFLYNSYAFHITMLPSALFAPVIVTVLWFVIAWVHRASLAPLLQARSVASREG